MSSFSLAGVVITTGVGIYSIYQGNPDFSSLSWSFYLAASSSVLTNSCSALLIISANRFSYEGSGYVRQRNSRTSEAPQSAIDRHRTYSYSALTSQEKRKYTDIRMRSASLYSTNTASQVIDKPASKIQVLREVES